MDHLRYDGLPDKRYKNCTVPNVIKATNPLPIKNGYVQFVFTERELDLSWVAVNNVSVKKED